MEQVINLDGKRILAGYTMASAILAGQPPLVKGKLWLRYDEIHFVDVNFFHGLLEGWMAQYDDFESCLNDLSYSLNDSLRDRLMAALRRCFNHEDGVVKATTEKYVRHQRLKQLLRNQSCKRSLMRLSSR